MGLSDRKEIITRIRSEFITTVWIIYDLLVMIEEYNLFTVLHRIF